MSDFLLNFACSHCGAEISAPAERSGKTMACMACNSQVMIPTGDDDDDYQLHDGIDQPETEQEYIPVVCKLCKTLMYGTVDQIGQLLCPDCGREAEVVRSDAQVKPWHPMLAPDYREGYDVADEVLTAVPILERPEGGALTCSACSATLTASGEKPGQRVFCRYCGALTVIPNPDEADALAVRAPFEVPALSSLIHPGVFNFPFYAGCWSRLLIMTFFGTVAIVMGIAGIVMAMVPVFGVCAFASAFLLASATFAVLSVFLLAVLVDTAEGCDAIESWPNAVWIDWVTESFFVFNSLALSVIPGFLIGFLFGFFASLRDYAALPLAGSMFILFPIILLSLQEANSLTQPFSFPVMRSLIRVWRAWIAFYALAAGLLLGVAILSMLLLLIHPVVAMAPSVGAMVYAAFVYFRMLGRLTQFIELVDVLN